MGYKSEKQMTGGVMKGLKFVQILVFSFLVAATASLQAAEYRNIKTSLMSAKNTSEKIKIKTASIFNIIGSPEKFARVESAEAVGKNIRREYYQMGYLIGDYVYTEVSMETAEKALRDATAEFKSLTRKEIDQLSLWIEDKMVDKVYKMDLEVEYMGGTAIEENYIYLPSASYDSVLVITKRIYAE